MNHQDANSIKNTHANETETMTADETERKTSKGEDEGVKATELPAGLLQTPQTPTVMLPSLMSCSLTTACS